jgi:hypothetical protein
MLFKMNRFSSSSSSDSSSSNEFTYTMEDDDLISVCSYDSSNMSSSTSSSIDFFDARPKLEIVEPRKIIYGFQNGMDKPYNPIKCYKCNSKMNTEAYNKYGNEKYNYVKCGVCRNTFCKKHVKLCSNCQNWYCKECVKYWNSLTVNSVKKHYCVYCEQTYKTHKKMYSKCVLI